MEDIRLNSSLSEPNYSRSLQSTDVEKKKSTGLNCVMFEGKNIHSSPIDGKLLCSYSEKLCKQRRLNGYAFCIRHVLEDKNAPFKQCQYVAKYNGQQCTNPIPFAEDRIYCNSHLQVLGLVPKKSRKKKASESIESDVDSVSNATVESRIKADVPPHLIAEKMAFLSPPVFPHRQKKIKSRINKKQPEILVTNKQKAHNKRPHGNNQDLFSFYGIDSDSSDNSDSEQLPWQQVWLSSDSDQELELPTLPDGKPKFTGASNSDTRTGKISRLSARLRRELHQLRRTLRAHRYRQPHFITTANALLKAAQTNTSACVDSILATSRPNRSAPMPFKVKMCAFTSAENLCKEKALPYTKYCKDHVTCDPNQVLYEQCTARFPDGLHCSVPVLDLVHERALCGEHARKKAKFQEAQEAAAAAATTLTTTKQAKQAKPQRKPLPKTQANKASSKPTKVTRKPTSRSNKGKIKNLLEPSANVSPMSDSFSQSDTSAVFSPSIMASDFSQASETSPVPNHMEEDLQQFQSSLFENQQQDSLLLNDIDENNLSCQGLPPSTNGVSQEGLFQDIVNKKSVNISKWEHISSVPVSVVTSTEIPARTNPPLNSEQIVLSKNALKGKSSPLNSKAKSSSKVKGKRNSKPKITHPNQGEILGLASNLDSELKDVKSRWTLSEDPMFSTSHSMLSTSELKTHGNGLSGPLSHSIESVLSPPQRSWPGIAISSTSNSYTSPLNSHTSQSRLTSPPFSPPTIPQHTSSVFTFDRPVPYQQTSMLSPTLSPASPSFLHSTSLKQSISYSQRDDLDSNRVHDPFLTPVDHEQPLLGTHFHQNSDTSLGDLRLR
ncbi:INO80 complex subunit D-B isoform X2 [Nematostella vectensis]|uniref:INO80 complex subunit D-B isoform X2 n=1 Tax=Nematostella vectensis TaxID=45351 RepID=UPI00207716EE|nr:INO80 complex subunit D-B isoform X2 [Nematostella vectensis]